MNLESRLIFLIIIVWFVFILATCHARLGDTPTQIAIRYGAPVKLAGTFAETPTGGAYSTNGFKITVAFDASGHSTLEVFSHPIEEWHILPPEITGIELTGILSANAGTNTWKNISHHYWQRSDGQAYATYDGISRELIVCTKAWYDASTRRQQRDEQKNIGGF